MDKTVVLRKTLVFVVIILFILTNFSISISGISEDVKSTSFSKYSDDLPLYFSWCDIDGVDFTTPAKQQIGNSCEAFSLCAAVETMVHCKIGYPFGCDLSEAHLFFCSGGCEWGTYLENAADYLVEYGVPDESCWPFTNSSCDYPYNTICSDWQNRAVKIQSWGWVEDNVEAIKRALINYGPIITYIHVYSDFFSYHDCDDFIDNYPIDVYRHRWGGSHGPHYVTIVGYNDDKGYWICKNNWGQKWGDDGFFKIYFGECAIEKHSIYLENVYGNFPIKYVDDDNTDGPWDGTAEHPYQKTQDGVDNAPEGYTIYVCNGIYHENVVINKTINLDGEDSSNTIIDGDGNEDVLFISAEGVRISGFTIQKSGDGLFDSGIKIRVYGDADASIHNNEIQNNRLGIYLYTSFGCTIKDNIIQNNRDDGMHLFYSLDERNNLNKNGRFFQKLKHFNNHIEDNVILNNGGDGIELEYSRRSFIAGNVICNNSGRGIYLRDGSNGNSIQGNSIENNGECIELIESNKNTIICNNFIDNQGGIYFLNSFFNRWARNHWNYWLRAIPKPLKGSIGGGKLLWVDFDLHPSKKPYETINC